MDRRNFLVGLVAAPAIVKLVTLMPIRIWRPLGHLTRNIGMGPFIGFRAGEVAALDIDGLDAFTFAGSPGKEFIHLTQQTAGLVTDATNRRKLVLDPAAMQAVQRLA